MRYLLLSAALLIVSHSQENSSVIANDEFLPDIKPIITDSFDDDILFDSKLDILISAMIIVESGGNESAYCKSEEAVGCLQIRPIMLKECNRILKLKKSKKRYSLRDRWSCDKSVEIFKIVSNYHNKNSKFENIARFWNGGPNWSKKDQTKVYWSKVKQKLMI
jgi:hypothetical protein